MKFIIPTRLKNFLIICGMTIIFLSCLELIFRLFWTNPYLLHNEISQYTRFHPRGLNFHIRADKLYENGGKVRFRINSDFALTDGNDNRKDCLALGGSTTESALVPEGKRWPDLLDVPTRNYGVSENTLYDSYQNLIYLVKYGNIVPRYVFILHGVNDIRAFLYHSGNSKHFFSQPSGPVNPLSIDNPGRSLLLGLRIMDSYLISFTKFQYKELFDRFTYRSYLAQRLRQSELDTLTESDFQIFADGLKQKLLPQRWQVLIALDSLSREYQFNLVLLTQPHCYQNNFRPYIYDLRLYPIFEGKKLSVKQAAFIMDIVNDQSRVFAESYHLKLIDMASIFRSSDPGPLFYDSVHFTPKGCRLFADTINKNL